MERAAAARHWAVCEALLMAGVKAQELNVLPRPPSAIFEQAGQVVLELRQGSELQMAFLVKRHDSWACVREEVQERLKVCRASHSATVFDPFSS